MDPKLVDPPPISSPNRKSSWRRTWFGVVVIVGVIAATAIALLALGSTAPGLYAQVAWVRDKTMPEMSKDPTHHTLAIVYLSVLVVLSFVVGVLAAALLLGKGWVTKRGVFVGWVLIGCTLLYLAHDEPLRTSDFVPISNAEATPEEKSAYAHLMIYGKRSPASLAFKSPDMSFKHGADKPSYLAWLKRERSNIDRSWEEMAELRAWWDKLDQFEQIPDLSPGDLTGDIPAYEPYQAYSRIAGAKACLLALDGQAEGPVELIQPALRVGIKLQANSHTLVQPLLGLVLEKVAIDDLTFVLETRGIPEPQRQQLRAILRSDPGVQGLRQIIDADRGMQTWTFSIARPYDLIASQGHSWSLTLLYVPIEVTTCFVYNPHRTMNAQSAWREKRALAASRRDLKEVERIEQPVIHPTPHFSFKNGYGEVMLGMLNISAVQTINMFWDKEDKRLALLKKLEAGR